MLRNGVMKNGWHENVKKSGEEQLVAAANVKC